MPQSKQENIDLKKYFDLFEKDLLGIEINMDKGELNSDLTQI